MSYSIESEPDPFGAPVVASGNFAYDNPFRFSTKHADDETSLIYYGYRYLSPGTGRWTRRDPLEELGGYNLHAFVQNGPTGFVDPYGERGGTPYRPPIGPSPYYPPGRTPNLPGVLPEVLDTFKSLCDFFLGGATYELDIIFEVNAELENARRNTPCGEARTINIVVDGRADSHAGSGSEPDVLARMGTKVITTTIVGTKGADPDGSCCVEHSARTPEGRCCKTAPQADGGESDCSPPQWPGLIFR